MEHDHRWYTDGCPTADVDELGARVGRLEAALERLGDWRLDKALQHAAPGGTLRALAQTPEEHDLVDRYQGWFLAARDTVDAALARPAPGGLA